MPRHTTAERGIAHGHPDGEDEVRVIVIDDQPIFRKVMRELVEATHGFVLVAELSSGEAALAALPGLRPDFAVTDTRLPGMGGPQTATALLEQQRGLVVLLVSVYELAEPIPVGPSGEPIPFVFKERLRPQVLRDVWDEHRPRPG